MGEEKEERKKKEPTLKPLPHLLMFCNWRTQINDKHPFLVYADSWNNSSAISISSEDLIRIKLNGFPPNRSAPPHSHKETHDLRSQRTGLETG